MKRYHVKKCLPIGLLKNYLGKTYSLKWTNHAKEEFYADPLTNGNKSIPKQVRITESFIFEITTDDDHQLAKFAQRQPFQRSKDLTLVLAPTEDGSMLVVTCWFNMSFHQQKNSDLSKYEDYLPDTP